MAATKSVRIPEAEYLILKEHAEKVKRDMAHIIAKAIRRYCVSNDTGKEGRE